MKTKRTKQSEKGRPLCMTPGCTIEVSEHEKYCPPTQWQIDRWLAQSKLMLDRIVAQRGA